MSRLLRQAIRANVGKATNRMKLPATIALRSALLHTMMNARAKKTMLNAIRKFVRDEDGLEMVEWGLVGALITAGASAVLGVVGVEVTAKLGFLETVLTGAP